MNANKHTKTRKVICADCLKGPIKPFDKCSSCNRIYQREWRRQYCLRNPSKVKAADRKYREANKDKVLARARNTYNKNRDKFLLKHNKWRLKNIDHVKRYEKSYTEKNRARLSSRQRELYFIRTYAQIADIAELVYQTEKIFEKRKGIL